MEVVQNFFKSIAAIVSKFYDWLPDRIRIAVYSGTSLLIASLLALVSRDLLALETSNEYVVVFVTFATGIINEIQKSVADAGTRVRAEKKDPVVIEKLDLKIEEAKEIKSLSK